MQYRPGYPQTSTSIQEEIWIDISKRVDYASLQWEQQATDQNTTLRFDIFTMLPLSSTRYDDYQSWLDNGNAVSGYMSVSLGIVDAINDPSFFIDVANRTEVKIISTNLDYIGIGSPDTVLWGGVVSSVDTERNGDSFIVQRVECSDYTALLDELIVRDYNAPTVSEELQERATISGLTTEVVVGGLTLTAGPYTFRVVAYNSSDEIVEIFTHVTQQLTATDIDPPGISDPPLRTIKLDWTTVAGASYYKVFAKSGIGTKDMYYKTTVTSPTVTYSMSTAPAVSGDLSPESKVQKGSIDIDVIRGSTDSENANYKGIFNAIDPELDPGIDNQTGYVETAKKLNDGTPDPDKSYRFSPTLETGIVLTSPFGGKTIKQALNIITEKTGAVFWVDQNKYLHYTNKQARELVDNPRFESSPASSSYLVANGHSIEQNRGPFGYGRALVAPAGATTVESKTNPIPVTANNYYFARVRGWAKSNFAAHWNAELVFYSNAAGTIEVGNSHELNRNIAFDSTDDGRWCKAWVLAQAHESAVSARIVVSKKSNGSDEVAWTDFSLVQVDGGMGYSDSPSEVNYALPLVSFETPKAPRSASKVANRLLVYGVYKNIKNPSELESIETDVSLTLKKVAAGSLAAAKYYVRVVAVVNDEDVICTYATETITDQDVTDGIRELYAQWAAVPGATEYKIYVGTKRFAMRLKATQVGTTLSIQSPAAGGAAVSPEPEVYYYKTFDFAPGIWESGGKIVEAAINDSLVDNDDKAQTRALSFWEEKGIAERTWEFDTFDTRVPYVGSVIPFIWAADDTAEPLMVKGVKARLLGDRVYYTVIVGDDPLLTKRGVTQIFADMQAATARLNDTIAPEPPQALAVAADPAALIQTPDGVTRASVTAQWTPSPEDDFSHYSVEYGYDANFTEVQRANVSQTSDSQSASTGIKANVVHTFQAEPGKKLYYRVAAIDATNNRSQWSSDEIDLPQDTTPCDAPGTLTVESGLRSNTLTWTFAFYDPANPTVNTNNTDFARFRLYRRVHNTGSYVAVAETSATQYVDTDFANYASGYNYAVTSLDRTGNESGTPGTGGASGVSYNTTNNIPSKINGGVDITAASISGAEIASATITDANIDSLSADKITAGTLNISTGMTIVSDGTATLPQFEVDKDGITIRDDAGNIVLQVNGTDATFNADYIDVSGITADEITVGSGENVVRAGTNASPSFSGIWAGNSDPSKAPFSVNLQGEVAARNITVYGGDVLIGEIGPSIDEVSINGTTGIVTVITTAAYDDTKYVVGAKVLIDTVGTYGSASWANGYFTIASTPTSTTFTYDSGVTGTTATDSSATGTVYLGGKMAVGGDGGTTASWMTIEGNAFSLKNPANAENIITANNASVSINADYVNAGQINIGTLDNNALTTTNFSVTNTGVVTAGSGNNVSVISPTDSTYRLWIGHSTGASAPFSVTAAGAVSATSGSVGGWSLSSTSLTGGDTTITNTGNITLGTGENVARLSSSDAAYRLWLGGSTASTAPFRVTSTGLLTATGVNISGTVSASSGSFTGTITTSNISATGGTIGGWSLTSTSLTNYGGSTGQYAGIIDTDSTGFAFFAGASTSTGTSAAFSVTNAGALTATNATISGAVTATSGSFNGSITAAGGSIGGWTIATDRIWSGSGSSYFGMSTGTTSFFAGANTSSGGSALFSVTNAGYLTASSGTIGGFNLSATSLTAGSSGAAVGLAPGTYPFYAGNTTASSAPFRVTNAGKVTANSIILGATQFTVTNAAKTSSSATITIGETSHPFIANDYITVALASGPTNYGELNGTWIVTGVTTTTITFTTTGTSTVTSGAAVGYVSYGAGNDAAGKIALVPASNQGASTITVQADETGNLYTSATLSSATSASASSDSTVTTTSAHGFVAGQFVSFSGTGNSTWNGITASYPVQIKAIPSSTQFTFRPFFSLSALSAVNGGSIKAYKRLSVVAPGGLFVYQGGSTPGVTATGSLVLGSSFSSLGVGTLGTVADGEIGFLSSTSPRYTGGGNLFSPNGTSTVATSGDFEVGTSLSVGTTITASGNISGSDIIANGAGVYIDGANPGLYFRDAANAALGAIIHNGTLITTNDSLSVTGTITASSAITAGGSVTVDDTLGVYFNVASGTDGNIYYNQTNGYFVVNDDWRINMGGTTSISDIYINTASGYGTLARFSSARRYKQDINDFNVPLSDVLQLRPVTFKWNPETTKSEETGEMTGLIAEEVEAISDAMKRICRYNEETGQIESVQYSQLSVFLIGAIKELAQKNNALEARIADLESR
jgi:hypothetical protein